jgi:N-acetylmuramoyl-L-alanine amidase
MIETRRVLTPNKSSRAGRPIRLIVLHADGSPREASTIDWIQRPEAQVSYHVLIHRDGTSTRFVDDGANAWHAGRSEWRGVVGVNRISLGLAFANKNDGREALTAAQVVTARQWVAHWMSRYPIEDVTTHARVSPGRKDDPERCPQFDLSDYRPHGGAP